MVGLSGLSLTQDLPWLVGLALFYCLLLRSAPNMQHAPLHSVLHALILFLFVPPKYGFTYVQTSLLWLAACYDLRRPQKDAFYDLNALLISVPVGFVSWAEGLGCDSFFKSLGGHVWYDLSIPLSMLAYCAVIFFRPPRVKQA